MRGAAITSRRFCGNCTGCSRDNESNSRWLSWSSSVYPAMHRRICQRSVGSPLTSTHADSARSTQRRLLFDDHTTLSAISVSPRLDHTCVTRYPPNDDNKTLSRRVQTAAEDTPVWRPCRFVCDSLVKSAIEKSSYLLTYRLLCPATQGVWGIMRCCDASVFLSVCLSVCHK